MSNLEHWKLCDRLSLVQAALLMGGHDPVEHEGYVEDWRISDQPQGYHAYKTALLGAVEDKKIDGEIRWNVHLDINGDENTSLDFRRSYVKVHSLKLWLVSKGFRNLFFFPDAVDVRDYVDALHPRYAPKLAAAVAAWEAADADSTLKGTPKQKITRWLRMNAVQYGLTLNTGKPNETAIREIAKIANWRPEGGAPVTGSEEKTPAPPNSLSGGNVLKMQPKAVPGGAVACELDDEIPF